MASSKVTLGLLTIELEGKAVIMSILNEIRPSQTFPLALI